MNSRIGIATLVVCLAGAPILALAVLTRPAPETETGTAEQPSAVAAEAATGGEAAAQLAAVSTSVAAAVAPAAEQSRRMTYATGGTVTLTLQRTDTFGANVNPGNLIEWEIVAQVTTDNDGLALISVDLIQGETNPELIDLDVADRPAAMVDFDRPNGIANPDPTDPSGPGTAYGGTQIAGATGGLNLIQIGGSQNTFGIAGDTIGLDADVDTLIGHADQVIASGSFDAPNTLGGPYTFDLLNGVANTLEDLPNPPAPERHWPVHEAVVDDTTSGSFSFTVVQP